MKAKYNQKTRDFIEELFKKNNYSLDRQISYLEIQERQKYNYYCDLTNNNWNWPQKDIDEYESAWNEIIEMLNERKKMKGGLIMKVIDIISLVDEETKVDVWENSELIATYDGKNSIPEELNSRLVKGITGGYMAIGIEV